MNLNLNLEPRSRGVDLAILAGLALMMVATRANHFAAIPDASWAIFFVGGFYLRHFTKWAFPLLMALAVVVDWAVITAQGINFWSHYCVSPGYWMLVPAYFSLWAGDGVTVFPRRQQRRRLVPQQALLGRGRHVAVESQ